MWRRLWSDWVLPILIAVVLAVILRIFVLEPRVIPSGSMEPTLQIGDRVIVEKLFFNPAHLHRGDVIVFRQPGFTTPLIKRVIGLPGDTVLIRDKNVYVNGQPLYEPYIMAEPAYDYGPVTVLPENLFVLGDNRNNSDDSHAWGFVSFTNVIGKADLIYWPPAHIGLLTAGGLQTQQPR
jgi:signal peptidase I